MPYLSVKINLGNLYIFQSHKVLFLFFWNSRVLIWFLNITISISWEQIHSTTSAPLWDCSHDVLWLSGTEQMIVSFPNMVWARTDIRDVPWVWRTWPDKSRPYQRSCIVRYPTHDTKQCKNFILDIGHKAETTTKSLRVLQKQSNLE